MKKTYILAIVILIILVIFGGIIFLNKQVCFGGFCLQNKDNFFAPQKEAGNQDIKNAETVSLVIDKGEGSPVTVTGESKEGMTAFDLLKEKTIELNLTLETKTYDMGIFIEAIGDKKNGEGGKYWLYYINSQMPQVAADKYLLKVGDKVEFKFEKSPF